MENLKLEFLRIPYLDKFDLNNNDIKFKNGLSVKKWINDNLDDIINSYDSLDKLIKKQYFTFLRFKEFEKYDGLEKFDELSFVPFEDDLLYNMSLWHEIENDKLVFYNKSYAKKYEIEKKEYEKLIEFFNDDIKKFDKKYKIYFSNSRLLKSSWFEKNKPFIFSSNMIVCVNIKKQYQDYCRKKNEEKTKIAKIAYKKKIEKKNEKNRKIEKKEKIKLEEPKKNNILYLRKLEFISIPFKEKFNEYSEIMFKDGSLCGRWYKKNKNKILNSNDGIDEIIKLQSYNYCLPYELKLIMFESLQDLNKFDKKNICYRFIDDKLMEEWFYENKNEILQDSKIIKKEYDRYLKK